MSCPRSPILLGIASTVESQDLGEGRGGARKCPTKHRDVVGRMVVVGAFGVEDCLFDSTSSRHVGTLGTSFTHNCLYDVMWRPVAALWLNSTESTPVIHSFGYFYSAPSSPLLHRGAPDYSTNTVSEFHTEAHRQLQVKDLPKVLMWRLERESNPRPPVESHRLNQGATTSHCRS